MQTRERNDITPRPAEFNVGSKDIDPALSAAEVLGALLAMCALALTVVAVTDPWTRLAGVLVVTGVLSAFVARRVVATSGA